MTKIYTRKGDRGLTSTQSQFGIPKNDPLIELLGCLDETISAIGLMRAASTHVMVNHYAVQLQVDLYDMMADISKQDRTFGAHRTERLEMTIDLLDRGLPELKDFIIPGETLAEATAHVARTTARRAERFMLFHESPDVHVVSYLNRLSDVLFTMARCLANGRQTEFKSATNGVDESN